MGELAMWQQRVEKFVLDQVGPPPARVLEVGCGEGELAHVLARAGCSVTAIDPRAPEGPIFRPVGIKEFTDPGPFDHVVASLSLHHIEDLGGALDKILEVLRTGGSLVVVEFAWDRIDEATAEWALERLPDAALSEEHSWLGRRCQEWESGGRGGNRARADSYSAEWASEEGFHSSRRMRDELRRRFVERCFEWVPYLYPDLREDVREADESAAIEARAINATGFRYVGAITPATERSRAPRRG
jgi:ubiquinone/menaquinone biosynthesis C-methylase UbiE